MSIFLRWGIFGILGVAALVYAYNASKHMADKRAAHDTPAAETEPLTEEAEPEQDAGPEAAPHCEAELAVAKRAIEARSQGEPLDRLLRSQEIAFQEPLRRERLEKVATYWFHREGAQPNPEVLRAAVISDCVKASP